MKKPYTIVYEDEFLLIVNKMAGIPVVPGRTSEMSKSLKYIFKAKLGEIFIVHRIDSETSGLVILAKNAHIHRALNTMFQNRQIHKSYLAITRGIPRPESGEIDFSLKKLNNQNKSVVSKDGKPALTRYKVNEIFGNIAAVNVEILTGRHHQIRVHFAKMNTPLLVDSTYGDESFFLSELKGNRYRKGKDEIERPLLSRLSLHAQRLKFSHPETGETIDVTAELPKDLRAVFNQLNKAF